MLKSLDRLLGCAARNVQLLWHVHEHFHPFPSSFSYHLSNFPACQTVYTHAGKPSNPDRLLNHFSKGASESKRPACLYIVIQCMATPQSHQRQPTSDP